MLVDEAYYEFHGKTVLSDVVSTAKPIRGADVLQGLRTGRAAHWHSCRSRAQMAMVRRVASPYSVNAVALAALPVALEDGALCRGMLLKSRKGANGLDTGADQSGIAGGPARRILS